MSYIYDLTDTWTASGTTYHAIKMNVTNTASAAASKLVTLQIGGTDKFTVDKDGDGYFAGQVGIGTSSPSEKLSVENSGDVAIEVKSTGTGDADAVVIIDAADTGEAVLEFRQDGVAKAAIEWFSSGSPDFNFRTEAGTNGVIDFQPNNSLAMRIDSSGNVLVGKTAASILTAGAYIQPLGFISLTADSQNTATFNRLNSNGEVAQFRRSSTQVGSITVTTTATAYNTSSDARLKENIADADDAASLIDAIQVRQFDWKADGSHQRYGMVAQELAEVAPEAVHQPDDEDEMMAVDYSKLVPMLVKEIQSLRARVAQLEG